MRFMTVTNAAKRLDVTTRQVQHLVARGELRGLARGLVDAASVERMIAVRAASHTRAWSVETAWGAIALLSGGSAEWMQQTQRSRLRARLRSLTAEALIERTRNRAEVTHYRAHSSAELHLRSILVSASASAERLGLAGSTKVDGYLVRGDVGSVVHNHGLIRDDEGEVTLRATTMNLETVSGLADRGNVLAAVDLAGSLDARERNVGLSTLEDVLKEFRG